MWLQTQAKIIGVCRDSGTDAFLSHSPSSQDYWIGGKPDAEHGGGITSPVEFTRITPDSSMQ